MSYLLMSPFKNPIGPFLNIMDEDIWHFYHFFDSLAEFFNEHLPLPRLPILLRKLARRTKNDVCNGIIFVGEGMAAKSARLQRNCTTAGKRIKNGWNLSVISNFNQFSGNAQYFYPLQILRITGLPFH